MQAATSLFVPAAIFNNTSGDRDAAVCKRFKEPAWNNPVVRILGPANEDLVPRLATDWTKLGLVQAMLAGLEKAERPAPNWLRDFGAEMAAHRRGLETAVFGMT